jgi:diaminopimelate decarboxylase
MRAPEQIERLIRWVETEPVPSPALLLAPGLVHSAVDRLRRRLAMRISFATKANAHPRLLAELAGLVDEFNVTNLAHLQTLIDLGVQPARIALVHPVLPRETLRAAAELGVTRFVVDDERGFDLLRSVVEQPRVTLRVLPPAPGGSARSVVRFGNTGEALENVAATVAEAGATVEALSFFVGAAGKDLEAGTPFRLGVDLVAELHAKLAARGLFVPTINIGGGFPGAQRRFHRQHPEFFPGIAGRLADRFGDDVGFLCEPGRYLSEPALILLTRVIADRVLGGRRLVHVDASAYATLFESCFIALDAGPPVICAGPGAEGRPADVVGPLMDSFDVVRGRVDLPPLEPGAPLLVPNVGAYAFGYCATPEGLAPPPVVELPAQLSAVFEDVWFT